MKSSLKPFLFIIPGLLPALLVISFPVYDLVRLSFHEVGSFGDIREFTGWLNYQYLFEDPLFWEVLLRTLYWTVFVVSGTVLVSVPVALILNEDFPGRGIARAIIMLPWAISLAMTAVIWKWLLNPDYGMLNHILRSLGLIEENIGWLSDASLAFPLQIFIGILVSIPFTVSVFLGGLSSISHDIYEASFLEGSNLIQRFFTITLPLLKSFISIAVVLNVIYVFNSFPIIWVLTEGGPANSTDILPTYLYKVAFQFGDIGVASSVSLIMFGMLLIFTIFYASVTLKGGK